MTRVTPFSLLCLALIALWPAASRADMSSRAPAPRETGAGTRASYPKAPARSLWRPEWRTFSRAEGVATVAAGIGTGVLFLLKPRSDPRWEGGILFDDSARSALRLRSPSARDQVQFWGDMPYYAAPLLPLIVDPLVAAWAARGDKKAAMNLGLVSLEAFSFTGLASFGTMRLVARERPDSAECRRTREDPKDCPIDTESFYSGHTTIAAASAGIVCANHRAMPLWGSRAADVGACALATTGAVASGVSRVAADRHYATDVLAGFGMGFGIGYAVPTLLHYSNEDTNVSVSISPGGPCTGACLKVAGSF